MGTAVKDRALRFVASERAGEVSALLRRPDDAFCLLVLAHGAGADMHHVFMEDISARLAQLGVATLRYQYPYAEAGKRRPDHRNLLLAATRAAFEAGREVAEGMPLLAGGKSMGGRMSSLAVSEQHVADLQGLVFFGFPLHAAGKPSEERGEHLAQVSLPMLFLQGTRDRLAEPGLIEPICGGLGDRATLHWIEEGDHSFHVPKRTGRTDEQVREELAEVVRDWARQIQA